MSVYRFERHLAVGLLAVVGLVQGCGTGEYEKRLQQRVTTLGQESAFAQFGPQVQVPGAPVFVSLPPDFQPLGEGSDAKRVKIPYAELADRKATYEAALADSAQGKQHYYCYVAVTDPAGDKDVLTAFQTLVRNAFQDSTEPAADVQVDTPSGQKVPWRRFRARGKQDFLYTDANGQERFAEMEGVLDVWGRKVDGAGASCYVILAWRVPTSGGQDFVGLEQKAALAAGSVTVKR